MRGLVAVMALTVMGCGATERPPMRRLSSGTLPFLAVEHVNLMGSTFELIGLHVGVDGREVLALESEQPLPSRLCVSRGAASVGSHEIRIRARYRGHGLGVFSYLSGYRFDAAAATDVDVPADAYGLEVRSEGVEGGGATTPLEDRPQIRFVARAERMSPQGGCVPTATGQPPAR